MFRIDLNNVGAHKGRLLTTLLAVPLSVAFVCDTRVFAESPSAAHRAAASKNFAGTGLTVTRTQPPPGEVGRSGGGALAAVPARRAAALRPLEAVGKT
ncbi:hypothetical protein ACWC9H_12360 [Streptomyces sp. NPDC001251]